MARYACQNISKHTNKADSLSLGTVKEAISTLAQSERSNAASGESTVHTACSAVSEGEDTAIAEAVTRRATATTQVSNMVRELVQVGTEQID